MRLLLATLLALSTVTAAHAARPAGAPRAVRKLDAHIQAYPGSQSGNSRERTIWGAPQGNLRYEYMDRLRHADPAKDGAARTVADESPFGASTAGWFKAYLGAYYGKPVNLRHITVSTSSGHAYQALGFVRPRGTTPTTKSPKSTAP